MMHGPTNIKKSWESYLSYYNMGTMQRGYVEFYSYKEFIDWIKNVDTITAMFLSDPVDQKSVQFLKSSLQNK